MPAGKSSVKTIAINALNSNSGGGRSIRDSYLQLLNEQALRHRYVVLVAKGAELAFVSNPSIEIRELPAPYSKGIIAPLIYEFALERTLKNIDADVVLNLGDLIVNTKARQLYLFDWSYALDVHAKVWAGMTPIDRLTRKTKLWLLRRRIRQADVVVAQTAYIKSKLVEKFGLVDVRVIGNAPMLDGAPDGGQPGFDLPEGVRLVCPSVYYPHKNLEILLDLGDLIKARSLGYRIITTVNPGGQAARRFLEAIVERRLQDVVHNIGQVPPERMKVLYKQCHALLMPTLLESFSIVYPEAMLYGLLIFTSDMWFARSVCADAAQYFDPLNAESILRSLEDVFHNEESQHALLAAGRRRLASFPTWADNFSSYQSIIHELLDRSRSRRNPAPDASRHG